MTELDRAAALAALTTTDTRPAPPVFAETGVTHQAGGDIELVALGPIFVAYVAGPQGLQRVHAAAGDRIQVSDDEAARLRTLGVVADASVFQSDQQPTDPGQPVVLDDAQLSALNAADTLAYVTSFPDELERVRATELARTDNGRKAVLDKLPAAQ